VGRAVTRNEGGFNTTKRGGRKNDRPPRGKRDGRSGCQKKGEKKRNPGLRHQEVLPGKKGPREQTQAPRKGEKRPREEQEGSARKKPDLRKKWIRRAGKKKGPRLGGGEKKGDSTNPEEKRLPHTTHQKGKEGPSSSEKKGGRIPEVKRGETKSREESQASVRERTSYEEER